MEGPILFLGYKEQESNLILPEHDDDDDEQCNRYAIGQIWAMQHSNATIRNKTQRAPIHEEQNTRQHDTNNLLQGNLYQRELTRSQYKTVHNNPMCINTVTIYIQKIIQSVSLATEPGISLTFRRLMSYTYGAPILDVSRSHTTTQHSRQDSSG